MSQTRTETDSFGPLEVPSEKYWGAQTQRSIINFPIGWEKQPVAVIRALGVIKQACAEANKSCLLYTSPSPRDKRQSRMPSSA